MGSGGSAGATPVRKDAVVVGTGAMGKAFTRSLATIESRVTGLGRNGRPDDAFEAALPRTEPPTSKLTHMFEFEGSRVDVRVRALPHTLQTAGVITPHVSGLALTSDVASALDATPTEILAGTRPTAAVAQQYGYWAGTTSRSPHPGRGFGPSRPVSQSSASAGGPPTGVARCEVW